MPGSGSTTWACGRSVRSRSISSDCCAVNASGIGLASLGPYPGRLSLSGPALAPARGWSWCRWARPDDGGNLADHLGQARAADVVLPYADHHPSCGAKLLGLPPVAVHRRLHLFVPPRTVGGGQAEVARTAVPETAVKEDADLAAGEH